MQKLFQSTKTQIDLIHDIHEWEKASVNTEESKFIENIAFFPYYEGQISALVTYRIADKVAIAGEYVWIPYER